MSVSRRRWVIVICFIALLVVLVAIPLAKWVPQTPGGLSAWGKMSRNWDTQFQMLPWGRLKATVTNRTGHVVYDVDVEVYFSSSVRQKVVETESLGIGASISKINHLPYGLKAFQNTPITRIEWRDAPSGPVQVETYPTGKHG